MNWKITDWSNVHWCEVFIMPEHQGGGLPYVRVHVFYKVAKWSDGFTFSGLFADKFPEIVKRNNDRLGQSTLETKLHTLIVHKDEL